MDERAKKLLVKRARRAKGQYVVFQVMRIESEFMAYYAGVMEMADWEGDLWDWGKRVRDCVMQAASVAIQQAARASQESERAA